MDYLFEYETSEGIIDCAIRVTGFQWNKIFENSKIVKLEEKYVFIRFIPLTSGLKGHTQ